MPFFLEETPAKGDGVKRVKKLENKVKEWNMETFRARFLQSKKN